MVDWQKGTGVTLSWTAAHEVRSMVHIVIRSCAGCPFCESSSCCDDSVVCGHPNAPEDSVLGEFGVGWIPGLVDLSGIPEWCPMQAGPVLLTLEVAASGSGRDSDLHAEGRVHLPADEQVAG